MNASLLRDIGGGDYTVDPDAVARAILRQGIQFGPVPVMPSEVLVPVQMFDEHAPGAGDLQAVALDDGA